MAKILEKAVKDRMKEGKCIMGTKQAITSVKNSKLIVLSNSIPQDALEKVRGAAKNGKVSTIDFNGSSVELGKLCGVQYRVSTLSLSSLNESDLKSILKESKREVE